MWNVRDKRLDIKLMTKLDIYVCLNLSFDGTDETLSIYYY